MDLKEQSTKFKNDLLIGVYWISSISITLYLLFCGLFKVVFPIDDKYSLKSHYLEMNANLTHHFTSDIFQTTLTFSYMNLMLNFTTWWYQTRSSGDLKWLVSILYSLFYKSHLTTFTKCFFWFNLVDKKTTTKFNWKTL